MCKAIAAVAVLVAVGCSSTSDNSTGNSAASGRRVEPEIRLVQTSNIPVAARFVDSALQIHYAMRVENLALEPITLKQVTIQSVSEGAYYVNPTSKPYDLAIDAKAKQDVEFWVTATPGRSLVGVNGPVTLRVTCNFDSPSGKFQQVVMRRVNERASITGQ